MPTVVRFFVKTSLLFLVLGMTLGMVQSLGAVASAFPVYWHVLTVGWLTQLIFGVAIWMLPKFSARHPRGYGWLNWLTYLALNGGLLLRVLFEPLYGGAYLPGRGAALAIAAALQWLAMVVFGVQAWLRVKGR